MITQRHPAADSVIGRYWVVIETGSNQRYIFGTNKRRANVGASELVRRVGTDWIDAVVGVGRFHSDVKTVISASGKAILLVGDQADGRSIVSAVTSRALLEAPGLSVSGAVDDVAIKPGACTRDTPDSRCSCASCRLDAVHRTLSQARANAGSPELRWPTNPFSLPCAYTGLPAVTMGTEVKEDNERPSTDSQPKARSAQFDTVFDHQSDKPAAQGLAALTEIVGDGHVPKNLNSADPEKDPVRNSGWIAIIHADGNGIGNLFLKMGRAIGETELIRRMSAFSKALDEVTRQAVRVAATTTASNYLSTDGSAPQGWILPIIVGGDDVTVIVDGRLALDFTAAFLAEFKNLAAENETIRKVNGAVSVPDDIADSAIHTATTPPPITASAGIAFIKPHHPFSDGYALAEQLCNSAKNLTKLEGGGSALDFHVLFDSVGRDLDELRDKQQIVSGSDGGPMRLWAGPVLVDPDTMPEGEPHPPTLMNLRGAMAALSRGTAGERGAISSTSAHALRAALTRGGPAIRHAREQAVLRAPNPEATRKALDEFLEVPTSYDVEEASTLSYWLDALALNEVAGGTAVRRDLTGLGGSR